MGLQLIYLFPRSRFIRRVKKKHLIDGKLSPEAFVCNELEQGISITFRYFYLLCEKGVDHYHWCSKMSSGDMLALVEVGLTDFRAAKLSLHWQPTKDPFGIAHYETTTRIEPPAVDAYAKADQLRAAAQERGILRPYVKNKDVNIEKYNRFKCKSRK